MRPFSPHLRLRRDRRRPERLIVESDVPLRAHALALSVGAALVVGGHGLGQLLSPTLGPAAEALSPLIALLVALAAWLALPSMVLTTSVGKELVEVSRSRRKRPQVRLLREEIVAVRLTAPWQSAAAAAPWRLADRQIELVTSEGNATVAIAKANEARALARGLSVAVGAPLRDDTPEAEAAYCLQQAMLAAGSLQGAAEPPEGFSLRAGLDKGWLVLELPARAPSRPARALLIGAGAVLLVAPVLLEAWPELASSRPLAMALTAGALAWLVAVVTAVTRSYRPSALAVSPLGVKVTRPRTLGPPRVVTLPPPVIAGASSGRLDLAAEARLSVPTGASDRDLAWAAAAIEALAGRPLAGG